MRPKSGITIMERLKREIFQSECFDNAKALIPNFMQLVEQKIVPIEGDINKEGLALKPQDRSRIISDV